jgi:hypothetical protein
VGKDGKNLLLAQASGATMSNEQQARKMLTAVANTAGGLIMQANIIQRVVHFFLEPILLSQARR